MGDLSQLAVDPKSLEGGVILDRPVIIKIRQFLETMSVANGIACICIGVDNQGRVYMVGELPGGIIQGMGLAEAGILLLGAPMTKAAAPTPPNVPEGA